MNQLVKVGVGRKPGGGDLKRLDQLQRFLSFADEPVCICTHDFSSENRLELWVVLCARDAQNREEEGRPRLADCSRRDVGRKDDDWHVRSHLVHIVIEYFRRRRGIHDLFINDICIFMMRSGRVGQNAAGGA